MEGLLAVLLVVYLVAYVINNVYQALLNNSCWAFHRLVDLLNCGESPEQKERSLRVLKDLNEEAAKTHTEYQGKKNDWTIKHCIDILQNEKKAEGIVELLVLMTCAGCFAPSPAQFDMLREISGQLKYDPEKLEALVIDQLFQRRTNALAYLTIAAMKAGGALTPAGVRGIRRSSVLAELEENIQYKILKTCVKIEGEEDRALEALREMLQECEKVEGTHLLLADWFVEPMKADGALVDSNRTLGWIVTNWKQGEYDGFWMRAVSSVYELLPEDVEDESADGEVDDESDVASTTYDPSSDLAELGVKESSSWDDIRTAYRTLAIQFHPDTLTGRRLHPEIVQYGETRLKQLNSAFSRLREFYRATE